MRELTVDKLKVFIAPNAEDMGTAAAKAIADRMLKVYEEKGELRMMFAAAPSQNTTLKALLETPGLPWDKVTAFHMDEYVGISDQAPQSFRNYLYKAVFSKAPFKKVYYIEGDAPDAQKAADEYAKLLNEAPLDIIVLGIGENGHIAFNDPPFSSFTEKEDVKVITMAERSRIQQVNDGCFSALELVPHDAITVTIPSFMKAEALFCVVPNNRKAEAVRKTLKEDVSEDCPASVLRRHDNAFLYIDEEAASLL